MAFGFAEFMSKDFRRSALTREPADGSSAQRKLKRGFRNRKARKPGQILFPQRFNPQLAKEEHGESLDGFF